MWRENWILRLVEKIVLDEKSKLLFIWPKTDNSFSTYRPSKLRPSENGPESNPRREQNSVPNDVTHTQTQRQTTHKFRHRTQSYWRSSLNKATSPFANTKRLSLMPYPAKTNSLWNTFAELSSNKPLCQIASFQHDLFDLRHHIILFYTDMIWP